MHTETFIYDLKNDNWNVDEFPKLDSQQTLVLIFGASEFFDNDQAIQDLIKHYPSSHILGCSTAGEIHNQDILDNSLTVSVTRFDHTSMKHLSVPISTPEEVEKAISEIANQLATPDLQGIFMLGSGLDVNFASIVREIQKSLGQDIPITGGVSGDGSRFERTWVLHDGKPTENMLTLVGFYGEAINIGYGSKGGWQPSGVPMMITKAKDNILYELNGRSALQWYKFQLRKYDVQLPAAALFFPLAIRQSVNDKNYIVRTILNIDEETGGLIFAGEIKERFFAHFMTATTKQLINGAQSAARDINMNKIISSKPLSIAVSCVGRRLVLEENVTDELKSVLEILPCDTHQVGFYSYGEICPSMNSGFSALHNQTMTLTLISEKES